MNSSSGKLEASITMTNASSTEGDDLYCGPIMDTGQMQQEFAASWMKCQYWCEGVLFSIVGAIGLLGNIISIGVLITR